MIDTTYGRLTYRLISLFVSKKDYWLESTFLKNQPKYEVKRRTRDDFALLLSAICAIVVEVFSFSGGFFYEQWWVISIFRSI